MALTQQQKEIMIGGTIVIGGLGYYYYTKSHPKTTTATQTTRPTIISTRTNRATPVQTVVRTNHTTPTTTSATRPNGVIGLSGWSGPTLIHRISAHDQFWKITQTPTTASSSNLVDYNNPTALRMDRYYGITQFHPLYPSHTMTRIAISAIRWVIVEQYTLFGYNASNGQATYQVIKNFYVQAMQLPSEANALGIVSWDTSGNHLLTTVIPVNANGGVSNSVQGILAWNGQNIGYMAFFPANVSTARYGPLSSPVRAPQIPNATGWRTFRETYGMN